MVALFSSIVQNYSYKIFNFQILLKYSVYMYTILLFIIDLIAT